MEQLSDSTETESEDTPAMDQQVELPESAEHLRDELHSMFSGFEKQFRKEQPILWRATLLAPVVVTSSILLALALIQSPAYAAKVVSQALFTFFVAGRFVLLGGVDDASAESLIAMRPGELFWMLTYMDFIIALFVTFHMGVLFRIPKVGPKLAMLVWDGKFFMDSQPWIKRMAFLGLVGFVIFPTSTTGSIGGSIFGRILGLSRLATVFGVLTGSLIGNSIMYFFAKQVNRILANDWKLKAAGLAIVIVGMILFEWRYRKVKDRYIQEQNAISDGEEET